MSKTDGGEKLSQRALCDRYPIEVWFRLAWEYAVDDIVRAEAGYKVPDTSKAAVIAELKGCVELDDGWELSDDERPDEGSK